LVNITNSNDEKITEPVQDLPPEYNEKISINGKSGLFLISGMAMMLIHLIVWIITYFV